jgi:hypothetical protein
MRSAADARRTVHGQARPMIQRRSLTGTRAPMCASAPWRRCSSSTATSTAMSSATQRVGADAALRSLQLADSSCSGAEYTAVVEFAPHQKVPSDSSRRKKPDARQGTILDGEFTSLLAPIDCAADVRAPQIRTTRSSSPRWKRSLAMETKRMRTDSRRRRKQTPSSWVSRAHTAGP